MDQERDLAIGELLRDLGWLPSDLNCEEKKHFAEEYLNATTAWFEVGRGFWLTQLRLAYKVSRRGEDETLVRAIDDARLKAARARLSLEAHIAAHNC
jgi:hypothetical protein